ncbi:dihydrofolate reductase [Micromonospora pisi]|uniref:Dihydrofolate reductase n=1 Tax=Micromonospora pisi TaxID=589240 RepID=A0A495JBR1_9ACTN|nr:dihydrofolate reductase family protein [Micromonospora pisi]RKR86450.1 dihydrofolate reductase [Micromonospora pisi]
MRKIVVSMWISLDGYVAGPRDEMDWLLIDEQVQRYEQDLVENAGSLMLGRITHADFAGYWPQAAGNPDEPDEVRRYARRVDDLEKIVVSASGNTAPWRNTRRLERIDPGEIGEIKRGSGGNVVIYGSLGVIRSLVDLRLVDEFHLLVHPLFLCRGKALFDGNQPPVRLGLLSAEPFASGVVLMKYRPIDDTPTVS